MKKNIIQQKRFSPKLKVKKGDKVVVISGSSKDKTKIHEIMEVYPEKQRVLIDQVNMVKKTYKSYTGKCRRHYRKASVHSYFQYYGCRSANK